VSKANERDAANNATVDTPLYVGDELLKAVAERLRQSIEATPIKISRAPNALTITVSIGIASSTGAPDVPDQLLRRADQALYRAKREGRNRVIAEAA
jgi:two-component system cell cycle response regulator